MIKAVFALLMLLAFALPAEAKPQLLCQTKRVEMRGEDYAGKPPEFETVEADLIFTPFEKNEYRAVVQLSFQMLPSLDIQVLLYETLIGQKLRFFPQLIVSSRSSGDIVIRGADIVKYRTANGRFEIEIACGVYDKTESLALPPAPTSQREKFRREILGAGPLREYSTLDSTPQSNDLDAYDLFQQLFIHATGATDALRSVFEGLYKQGYRFYLLGELSDDASVVIENKRKNQTCTSGGSRFTCDLETFTLHLPLGGGTKLVNGESVHELALVVRGVILRESESRLIRGYRINGVSTSDSEARGGGGSTSGGRIKGGN